mgnify:CR=1 FL=1
MRNRIIYPALCLMLSVVSSNAQKLYTLEECRTLALENSAKMKNSRFEVEVAKQTSKEAFTNYFPNVSDNIQKILDNFDLLFERMNCEERRELCRQFIERIDVFQEEREDGRGDFGSTCIYGWSHCQWE